MGELVKITVAYFDRQGTGSGNYHEFAYQSHLFPPPSWPVAAAAIHQVKSHIIDTGGWRQPPLFDKHS